MAARKKLNEMTPYERVAPRLKGLSNEEAEDVAVTILSQVLAKRAYIDEDKDCVHNLMMRLCKEADEYAERFKFDIALVKAVKKLEADGRDREASESGQEP